MKVVGLLIKAKRETSILIVHKSFLYTTRNER
jgi:hypothetical protein